ncbi:MAG: hypothetical protein KC877_02595 [Candidatus Kaiserbacteria bacterium]|nr:hypothetical protein [Candidatus Kaiserbacteria bacterium]MCB9816331.1 hypothetical protein [Candidatus Nomurabacteria bacterium]
MSPELLAAVKERLSLGHDVESIKAEMRTAGHDESVIEVAITAAQHSGSDTPVSTDAVLLPSFGSLFMGSLSYAWKKWSLVGWTLLLFVVFVALLGLSAMLMTAQPIVAGALMFIVAVGGSFLFLVFSLAVQRVVATDSDAAEVRLKDGWDWAKGHFFWSGLWVMLLMMLIVQGASSIIIPYIVIGPFISFMVYAYIMEGFTGLSSVFRARELGKGNWWPLLWRKGLFVSIIALPMVVMVIGAVVAMIFFLGIPGEADYPDLLGNIGLIAAGGLLFIVYAVFTSIWSFRFNVLLFRHLVAARPVTEASGIGTDKWKYVVLVIIGVLGSFMPSGGEEDMAEFEQLWQPESGFEQQEQIDFKDRAQELRFGEE